MIHHAVEVASKGMNVYIDPQDTDVLFLALRRHVLLATFLQQSWAQLKDDAKSSYILAR